jgi:chromosome segregation ATPase
MSELVVLLPKKENALQVFSADCGLEPYLARVRKEIDAFVPDAATSKGRAEIASMAHKVARSKTALDDMGKELVAELKDVPKKVDAERKRMRDLLDQWKEEVRAPLTAWEQAEENRKAGHRAIVNWFGQSVESVQNSDASSVRETLKIVADKVIAPELEEFEAEAHRAKAKATEELAGLLAAKEKAEAEAAELTRLRAEAAAREQVEREEKMKAETAAKAKAEAEAKAESEARAVEVKAQAEREAAERRELELKLQAESAQREKAEAQARELQAKAEAEQKAIDAANQERARIESEAKAMAAEQARRETDKAHRGAVNQAALAALVDGGVTEEMAKKCIELIYKKMIPSVRIIY